MNYKHKRKAPGVTVTRTANYMIDIDDLAAYEDARDALAARRRHYGIVGAFIALAIVYGLSMYGIVAMIMKTAGPL